CTAEEFWRYSVYRTNIPDTTLEPAHLASYFNKRKAEELIRSEILNASANLQDLARMEVHSIFEHDGLQAQILHFASGRSMEVYIEKELVEGNVRQPRIKLSSLPTTLYTVAEQLADAEPESGDNNIPNGRRHTSNRVSIWKESYVLRKHANE